MAVAWTSVLHNKYLQLCTGLAFSASRLDQLLDAPMHGKFCKELPLEELSDKLDVAEAMLLSLQQNSLAYHSVPCALNMQIEVA